MTTKSPNILIVEDVPALAEGYKAYLARDGLSAHVVHNGADAIAYIERHPIAVAIVDVHLPDMNGFEILARLRQMGAPTDVVIITLEGSINLAVEAMRNGAFDFIVKPFSRDRLCATVGNALKHRNLSNRLAEVEEETGDNPPGRFVGRSTAMRGLSNIEERGADQRDSLHHRRVRRRQGAVRGGAAQAQQTAGRSFRRGQLCGDPEGADGERDIRAHEERFQRRGRGPQRLALRADGGTLFLDEVAEMDIALQSKLLRFLQEKTVQRVGEDQLRKADVRIVCATNRDPLAEGPSGPVPRGLLLSLGTSYLWNDRRCASATATSS